MHVSLLNFHKNSLTHSNLYTELSTIHTKLHTYLRKSFTLYLRYLYNFFIYGFTYATFYQGNEMVLQFNILSMTNRYFTKSKQKTDFKLSINTRISVEFSNRMNSEEKIHFPLQCSDMKKKSEIDQFEIKICDPLNQSLYIFCAYYYVTSKCIKKHNKIIMSCHILFNFFNCF